MERFRQPHGQGELEAESSFDYLQARRRFHQRVQSLQYAEKQWGSTALESIRRLSKLEPDIDPIGTQFLAESLWTFFSYAVLPQFGRGLRPMISLEVGQTNSPMISLSVILSTSISELTRLDLESKLRYHTRGLIDLGEWWKEPTVLGVEDRRLKQDPLKRWHSSSLYIWQYDDHLADDLEINLELGSYFGEWMRTPQASLGGVVPYEILDDVSDTRLRDLILRIRQGSFT